ncbi:MAG: hypothetical protein WAT66_05275 [Actinomycetota bacterium]
MKKASRVLAAAVLGLMIVAMLAPAAPAAEATELTYSIKDARAFLWQIHYPQSTFISEFYGPCNVDDDPFACDRNAYDQTPGTCEDQALGRTKEAEETPGADELEGAVTKPTEGLGPAADWPRGNPVTVIHSLALGRLGSGESGGIASMYYVDNSGRRETRAHVESDGFVGNRNDYEERCAAVDAASESSDFNAPFAAHMLSRADQNPSTYNMSSFTTVEAASGAYPPGQPKEGVSIVKLWQDKERVNGLLTSTVRAFKLADQITVDAVRSIISFSSDGTQKGLKVAAKTEALGLTIFGVKLPALTGNQVIDLGDGSFLGITAPVVQESPDGHQLTVRAPGLFLAVKTSLNELPIPEDPFAHEEPLADVRGAIGDARDQFCVGAGRNPAESIAKDGCKLSLGGKLFPAQVIYVAGAILDAAVGRGPIFALPPFPPLPHLPPPLTPSITPPGTLTPPGVTAPVQPVGQARFVVRELAGSPWPLLTIVLFSALGLLAVGGRWSMRYPWAQALARTPPFPAVSWAYRAFLKD